MRPIICSNVPSTVSLAAELVSFLLHVYDWIGSTNRLSTNRVLASTARKRTFGADTAARLSTEYTIDKACPYAPVDRCLKGPSVHLETPH